jgi:hypothetical protein
MRPRQVAADAELRLIECQRCDRTVAPSLIRISPVAGTLPLVPEINMLTTILATVEAKLEVAHEVEVALKKMILPTRAEAGCVRYELSRSKEKSGTFHLLET